jgi:hypothetical protein
MRVLISLVTAVLVASSSAGQTAAPTAAIDGQRTDALAVRRVVLYKNGVGYFEHVGRVRGNQAVTIDFTSAQLNDVLKSLTTLDLGNGKVTGISYNSEAPLGQRLSALGLPLGPEAETAAAFFKALRGARLEARTPAGLVSGRLLSVEHRTRSRGNALAEQTTELSVVTDTGEVRIVELSTESVVRLADRELNQQVGRYLGILASAQQQSLRRMTISTTGTGERPLFVSYVSEVPVWKSTYRLVMPSKAGAKPFLQGWAIVDNTVGEDWTNVEMSLVAGAPQSFIQPISQPYYLRRPVVPLPEAAQLTPQTHEAGNAGGSGRIRGRVTDSSGDAIPGVEVAALGSDGKVAGRAGTDAEGRYELVVAPGSYTLRFELMGFKTQRTSDVEVAAGEPAEENATLRVGALEEAVTVTAPSRRGPATMRGLGGYGGGVGAPEADLARVADNMAALEAAASGREMGDLFEYRIKEPVTIRKNQSSMVPILNTEVTTEKVTIWNPSRAGALPLRGVWLTNSTGLTLDGGSFTVIESEAFAGEGLLEALKPGEKRLLSYAADTAVRIESTSNGGPRRVEGVRVNRGVIVQTVKEQEQRVYTIRNEDVSPRTVVIEHPVRSGWVLSAGAVQPAEASGGLRRFRVAVDAKKTATLTVDETRPREDRVVVAGLSADQLGVWLQQSGSGPSLEAVLRPVIEKKQALAALAQNIAARTSEVDRIGTDQQRVRENMKALKGTAEEKALVQRYARQLDEQETRLEALRKEIADLEQQRAKAQAELEKLIDGLTL